MHFNCNEQCLERKAKHCYHTSQRTRLPRLGFERPSDAGPTTARSPHIQLGGNPPSTKAVPGPPTGGHGWDRTVPALTQTQSNLWELRGSSPAQQREKSGWLEELQSITQLACTLWKSLASTDLQAEMFRMNTLEVV